MQGSSSLSAAAAMWWHPRALYGGTHVHDVLQLIVRGCEQLGNGEQAIVQGPTLDLLLQWVNRMEAKKIHEREG
jgi:hypothetical protein